MSLSSSLPSWPVSQSVICGAVTPHQALFPWRQALMGGVGNPRWWEATVICKAGRLDNGRAVIGTASLRWEGDCNGGQQKCMQIWHFQTHLHMYTWMFFFSLIILLFFFYPPGLVELKGSWVFQIVPRLSPPVCFGAYERWFDVRLSGLRSIFPWWQGDNVSRPGPSFCLPRIPCSGFLPVPRAWRVRHSCGLCHYGMTRGFFITMAFATSPCVTNSSSSILNPSQTQSKEGIYFKLDLIS